MKSKDFFRPLWLRVVIVTACAAWAAVEWLHGQAGWALMAGAATAYGLWSFIIGYPSDGDGNG